MTKIRRVYTCANCGHEIEFGDKTAVNDCKGNFFCDDDCAMGYYELDFVDWEGEDEYEGESVTPKRENLYGAHLAKNRIITNGAYAIVGADTSELNIDDGFYKNPDRIYAQTFDMRVALKYTKAKVVKLSECKVIDNTDGHIEDQQLLVFIEILGCKFDKRYVDLCVELLGLSDELRVCNDDPERPLLIEADDEKFAVIMPVIWDR